MAKTLRGKCPFCCPDGGAEFRHYGITKVCVNCGHEYPVRQRRKPTGSNKVQKRAIERILYLFGGEVTKQELIGHKVWITVRNAARSIYDGNWVYGTIGPRGALRLLLPRFFGEDRHIVTWYAAETFLKSSIRPEAAPAGRENCRTNCDTRT
jgi:hypothetical protein